MAHRTDRYKATATEKCSLFKLKFVGWTSDEMFNLVHRGAQIRCESGGGGQLLPPVHVLGEFD